jgi:hypothetical protein
MSSPSKLKAPFPAFGGKSRVADLVWERLGDVTNFIEPFSNSAAVLLARKTAPRIETINDLNCYVANFWRAVGRDPEAVADHADWPVNETDLHARHRWLVLSAESAEFRQRMRTDPEHYDPRIAGWWVWGACCWIGAGWCDTKESAEWEQSPYLSREGQGMCAKLPDISGHSGGSGRGVHQSSGPHQKRPNISGFFNEHGERTHHGRGVHGKVPEGSRVDPAHPREGRPQLADAFARGRGVNGNDSAETCAARRAWLLDWFARLADRLRTVRVCCGDWLRVCDSFSVTTRLGLTGVFLDAPYKAVLASGEKNRSGDLYSNDRSQDLTKLVDDVIKYCVERGGDPLMRICAASYEGEGYEVLLDLGWDCFEWKASGGYANRSGKPNENASRERLWFSPHCMRAERDRMPLFDTLEGDES